MTLLRKMSEMNIWIVKRDSGLVMIYGLRTSILGRYIVRTVHNDCPYQYGPLMGLPGRVTIVATIAIMVINHSTPVTLHPRVDGLAHLE